MTGRIGKYRPAKNVKPGWRIRHTDDLGESWAEVSLVIETEDIVTGERFVRFAFTDGTSSVCGRSADVMCRTLPEVRAAGSEDVTAERDTQTGGRL